MRYWVWIFYHGDRFEEVEAALKPWRQWGEVTGSGGGSDGVNDISWGMRGLDKAKERARKLHQKLKNIPHLIEVVDTKDHDHLVLLKLGKRPRARRSRR